MVLIILAGVSISMLTGENGIITQAQESRLQTEIGKEKEFITLSVSAIRGDKIAKGDTSEITSGELQNEINNYTNEATVTGSGTLIVTYESGRSYEVEQDGSITEKEELTPEEAKKIVNATGCIGALLVETADGTVYYVDDLQEYIMQKIEITDAEIITTNGIRESGSNYFIDDKGKVYTWGYNVYGQLGNGTNEDSNVPICISDIDGNVLNGKNIVELQYYNSYSVALDDEGKVYTWGYNRSGQLGNGTKESSNVPICISDIPGNALNEKNIVNIQSNGSTMIAIDNEGKVYTWGNNLDGVLGNGTEESSNIPICISDIPGNALNGKNIVNIQSNGSTMIAIDNEGKAYTWGNNEVGQLGNGTTTNSNSPICISDILENALNGKNIVNIQSNGSTMIAIDNEGKVYTWGDNECGQLGNGTNEFSNVPICISDIPENALNGKNIVNIQSDGSTMIAIDNGRKVYTWGDNEYGQLGDGTDVEYANAPICISDIDGNALNGKNIVNIQSDEASAIMIAIDSEGKVYTWVGYSNVPICISDIPDNELYNKKIKLMNITSISGTTSRTRYGYKSFITENGELYNIYILSRSPN